MRFSSWTRTDSRTDRVRCGLTFGRSDHSRGKVQTDGSALAHSTDFLDDIYSLNIPMYDILGAVPVSDAGNHVIVVTGSRTQDAFTGTIDIVSVRKRHICRATGPVRYEAGVTNGSAAQCCRGGRWSHRKYFDGYAAPKTHPTLVPPARVPRDHEQLAVRVDPTEWGVAPQHSMRQAEASDAARRAAAVPARNADGRAADRTTRTRRTTPK
jgi:hypothetical protein